MYHVLSVVSCCPERCCQDLELVTQGYQIVWWQDVGKYQTAELQHHLSLRHLGCPLCQGKLLVHEPCNGIALP